MTDNPTPDDSGAGGHPGTPSPQPWDLAAQGAAAVGTDLRGALALFQEAIDLSAGAGPADPDRLDALNVQTEARESFGQVVDHDVGGQRDPVAQP